jgi:hypothetical protein
LIFNDATRAVADGLVQGEPITIKSRVAAYGVTAIVFSYISPGTCKPPRDPDSETLGAWAKPRDEASLFSLIFALSTITVQIAGVETRYNSL